MEQMYYLWSASMQGWALHSGGYSTELKDAKQFTKPAAIARCILHLRKSEDQFGLLPVSVGDLAEIKGDA